MIDKRISDISRNITEKYNTKEEAEVIEKALYKHINDILEKIKSDNAQVRKQNSDIERIKKDIGDISSKRVSAYFKFSYFKIEN